MTFVWPPMLLLLLLLVPLGDRRWRAGSSAAARAAASLLRAGLGPGPRPPRRRADPRRVLPGALLVARVRRARSIGARPAAGRRRRCRARRARSSSPSTSRASMAATDLPPTRMDAAKRGRDDFVQRQPPGVVIGVVAFSDSGIAVQAPTNDQADGPRRDRPADAASAGPRSGRASLPSLDAIEQAEAGPPADYYSNRSPGADARADAGPGRRRTRSAVIVLLTDGENNERPDPIAAAQAAADRGVRIYTVGIGSAARRRRSTSTGSRSTPSSTRRPSQQIADLTGGTVLRGRRRRRSTRSTSTSTRRSSSGPSRSS